MYSSSVARSALWESMGYDTSSDDYGLHIRTTEEMLEEFQVFSKGIPIQG
jgi:hypothetical protein